MYSNIETHDTVLLRYLIRLTYRFFPFKILHKDFIFSAVINAMFYKCIIYKIWFLTYKMHLEQINDHLVLK